VPPLRRVLSADGGDVGVSKVIEKKGA